MKINDANNGELVNIYSAGDQRLLLECEYFHQLFFDRKPSSSFLMHYIAAHKCIDGLRSPTETAAKSLDVIVNKKLNAINIEPWLRNNKRHIVTSKLMLITSLAECDSAHPEFLRNPKGLFVAFLQIGWYGFLGAIKLIHGKAMVKIYGII